MKFLSIQPATEYFIWQHEVFDHQFIKCGYNISDSYVMFLITGKVSKNVKKYIIKNSNRVILIKDKRNDKTTYIPSLRFYGLYDLYKNHYHLIDGHDIFYHDSDIVFTKKFDWESIIEKPNTAYVSDTISYIGAKYIESKSPELLQLMCDVVGIDIDMVKNNEMNSGGAQYILPKNSLNYELFEKCEKDSITLYKLMKKTSNIYSPNHPIQAWTADMWALLWNLWLYGIETVVHRDMEFAWCNWGIDDWKRVKIYHNAGVVSDSKGEFYKGKYTNKMPFGEDFSKIKGGTCNYNYVQIINELSHLKDFYK